MRLAIPLFLLAVVISLSASAEMSAITVSASVVTFNDKTVTIRVNEKDVTVPREMLKDRSIVKGQKLLLTFRGQQISYLLPATEKDDRRPASESEAGK